ncbi:MAG: glycosyltransferase family 9 protein [Candidatus Jettenia sp. CY-1]|nr:MAG: glycosyltransferase family 9 protein [Candidatus Jettenia sp. CY-1]
MNLLLEFSPQWFRVNLFIACDSGPVHLACALDVRTIVLFQNSNFKRWGPPTEIAQIVYKDGGISAEHVLKISLLELYSKEIT